MAKERGKGANIKTIAERANVSISTVSRALRAHTNVNDETRDRVLRIAQEVGYVPNRAAQLLVSGDTAGAGTTVVSIVYDSLTPMSDHYFSRVIQNIVNEASKHGLVATISSVTEQYESILAFADQLRKNFSTGLILCGDIDDHVIGLFAERVPNIVMVDKPSRVVPSVCNDNEWGAYLATSYLAEQGFVRIALLESYPGHYFTRSVRSGYSRALAEHGLPFDPKLCVDGEYHKTDGYRPTAQLLELDQRPDAIFANDEMAIGAMRAIHEAGLRVPEDISLFGFDNLSIGTRVEPAVSTVGVNYEYLAKAAIGKIIENLHAETVIPVEIVVPVELIHRNSVAAPRKRASQPG